MFNRFLFKKVIKYMRSGDLIFLGLLALSYFMVESEIKDLREIGFFSFVICLFLYIANVTFRYSYTAWFDLRKERQNEHESQKQKNRLMAIREDAIKRMESEERAKGQRTTKRLQDKKRSSINISA
jgi:hypothetical protein